MEGVNQEMIDREIADVHADKPVVEKPAKPGRPRNSTKAAKPNGKAEKVLLVLTSNGENHGVYREITADEIDELSIQSLRDPNIRIASAVIAKVSAPSVSFVQ